MRPGLNEVGLLPGEHRTSKRESITGTLFYEVPWGNFFFLSEFWVFVPDVSENSVRFPSVKCTSVMSEVF